tara:strand:- start:3369 stop:4742 length:1374 start_codon:yes stop_codon:yes gene_type:complete
MAVTTTTGLALQDVSFAVPKVGIGLHFYHTMDENQLTSNSVTLHSDHISGKCLVPVTDGVIDNLTLEFAPGESGMTLDLTGTGAGKLDAGTATQGTFYDIRVISKRGSSAALLAHTSGKLEPGVTGIGGSFTLPAGYTHYSDVVFGVSYTAASVATFTFTAIPDDASTISLIDNAGSPDTQVFEFDDDASGVTVGGAVAVNPAGTGGDASATAAALVAAINADAITILAEDWSSYGEAGKVVLYQDSDSAYPGAGTGVTSIAVNSASHWNSKVDETMITTFSAGGIKGFTQVGPGECMYLTGGGGTVGSGGLNVLYAGVQHSDSAAIDISRCAPSPVAGTAYETRGTAFLKASATCTGSAARHCYWLYSQDGRTTGDSNLEDALELVHQAYYLDAASGGGPKQEESTIGFPLSVSATSEGYAASSTGTLANIFQYYFSTDASGIGAYVYVRGWKLNG